ncbi:MAG: hypothetical protein HRU21_09235 [Pseudomonadales bacterium]|nr:hypothetical protein [Pseudomonadales bacterium]
MNRVEQIEEKIVNLECKRKKLVEKDAKIGKEISDLQEEKDSILALEVQMEALKESAEKYLIEYSLERHNVFINSGPGLRISVIFHDSTEMTFEGHDRIEVLKRTNNTIHFYGQFL